MKNIQNWNRTKASNLELMDLLGVRIPPFIHLTESIINNILLSEESFYKLKFLDKTKLYSVRSSGSISTPGRMDTILNVKYDDLYQAFLAVKRSFESKSLKTYLEAVEQEEFVATIIIQEMVLVTNERDASGIVTTINPSTSEEEIYGNVVFNLQGHSLMSGKVSPRMIYELRENNYIGYKSLLEQIEKIKSIFFNPQEIEFTIKDGIAYILQSRSHYPGEKSLSKHPINKNNVIGKGLSATPYNITAEITHNREDSEGKILITDTTEFEDTLMLIRCAGIITRTGGTLCHAAIIANEFKIPCIVSALWRWEELAEGTKVTMHSSGEIEFISF